MVSRSALLLPGTAATRLGWGLVVQVIGMSSFARQTTAVAADELPDAV